MPEFRAAGADDLGGILALYRQLHPADPPVPAARDIFTTILGTSGLHLFVLEEDTEIVATTYLNVIPNLTRGGSPYAVIENVVVDAGRRGKGLGKQIMAATVQAAWDAGCYKAMLQTGSRTAATHAFYRRCGFSPDEKTAYVCHPA
ncbi:GNAT family N-acetyltransferase [Kribbella shirazensis]|uniref:GNAT superfamily N-acetyltransferase n=1 Tax=Kribbella shirazensis TaxID=1105143 RepID=A0A7X5VEJ0_9ACTN|nr:GNAT family N-acetyltransferase [Kribbella shirazensis]NIK59564.1 GNAT superfamily N-acetyltransferase [Kribbella shirazensis]